MKIKLHNCKKKQAEIDRLQAELNLYKKAYENRNNVYEPPKKESPHIYVSLKKSIPHIYASLKNPSPDSPPNSPVPDSPPAPPLPPPRHSVLGRHPFLIISEV